MYKQKLLFIFCALFSTFISAKKTKIQDVYSKIITNKIHNKNRWFTIVPLEEIVKKNSSIQYQKCFGKVHFNFKPFEPSSLTPHKGYFQECFILQIPQGRVQGKEGHVFINNQMIQEMVWAQRYENLQNIPKIENNVRKISGRVAVIAQQACDNYCHFFGEVLARLAMLEMHGIEYDWLYVNCDTQFVKEGLKLWGVDESKIICPTDKNFCIQADTLILPSFVINTNNGFKHIGLNPHPYTLQYVKQKLVSKIADVDVSNFSKRVFISRRDAPSRRITNEDAVFELFKAKGFKRYDTGKMPVSQQIALCAQAEIVAGEHGAGLTNTIFCKEGTKIIEIFQAATDSGFWWPAQVFNFNYIPINTLNVDGNRFYDWQEKDPRVYFKAMGSKINIPLNKIKKVVDGL